MSNPHPDKVGTVFNRQSPVAKADSYRPKTPDLLEAQRRVSGIVFKQLKVFSSKLLNSVRQRFKPRPELRRRFMHLQVSQFTLSFSDGGFLEQKVELPGLRIAV